MPIGSLVATGIAAKKIAENVATDLYELAKNRCSLQIKKWQATHNLDVICKRVRQIRLVKTIWQVEKEIDLTTFYHPAKVRVGDARIAIDRLSDLQ